VKKILAPLFKVTIFEMGGFRFVAEICLDHGQKRANIANPQNIDFHIVTSCGMNPKYSATKKGGYFFLVDGISHDSKCVALIQKKLTSGFDYKNVFKTIDMTNSDNWRNHMGNGTIICSKKAKGRSTFLKHKIFSQRILILTHT